MLQPGPKNMPVELPAMFWEHLLAPLVMNSGSISPSAYHLRQDF